MHKGSDIILDKIQSFVEKNKKNYFFVPSLGQILYLNALLFFDCIIGNSSSGIYEASLLKKSVINIGNRQKGRYRFGKVIDVKNDYASISHAIDQIFKLQKGNQFNLEEFKKSYISKSPSDQIIQFLEDDI